MICKRCGNDNPDGIAFCTVCGEQTQWSINATQEPAFGQVPVQQQAPVQQQTPVQQQVPVQQQAPTYATPPTPPPVEYVATAPPTPAPAPPKKKGKLIAIIIAIVIVVLGAAGTAYWLLKDDGKSEPTNEVTTEETTEATPEAEENTETNTTQNAKEKKKKKSTDDKDIEGVLKEYEECLSNADYILFDQLRYPEDYIENMIIDARYNGDEDAYEEAQQGYADYLLKFYEENDIEIISVEKDGDVKELSELNLEKYTCEDEEELLEYIADKYEIDAESVRKCTVKITAEVEGEEDSTAAEFIFYKADGEWYLLDEGGFSVVSDF